MIGSSCKNTTDRTFTLLSADDGAEIADLTFSYDLAAAEAPDPFEHGRPATVEGIESIGDGGCRGQLIQTSSNDYLLLVVYTEEVNGNSVDVFGVISEEGGLTTLAPEQEVSDFGTPVHHRDPVYDPVNERIVFVEYDTTSSEGIVQAMDLYSGEVSDLGGCEGNNDCSELTVLPESGIVVQGSLARASTLAIRSDSGRLTILESPDGKTLLHADQVFGTTKLSFIDIETALADNPDMIVGDTDLSEYQLELDVAAEPRFIDDNTLLLKTNELAIWEFTEELLAEHDYSEEGRDLFHPEHVPVEQSLIPESPRHNESILLSPDRSEVLFYSIPDTGEGSWYRVPTDGSGEPEEAFQHQEAHLWVEAWQ